MSTHPISRRVECHRCGRRVAVNGWGRMSRHLIKLRTDARCPGSKQVAPGWEWTLERAS